MVMNWVAWIALVKPSKLLTIGTSTFCLFDYAIELAFVSCKEVQAVNHYTSFN